MRRWVFAVVAVGLAYAFVGIVFAVPAGHPKVWRLAAWGVSAVTYGAHICYERFRLGNSPASAAVHIAMAVALGAFGLAAGANIHSLGVASTNEHRRLLLLALGLWPILTAVPAFLVALGGGWILARGGGEGKSRGSWPGVPRTPRACFRFIATAILAAVAGASLTAVAAQVLGVSVLIASTVAGTLAAVVVALLIARHRPA